MNEQLVSFMNHKAHFFLNPAGEHTVTIWFDA